MIFQILQIPDFEQTEFVVTVKTHLITISV